MTIEDELLGRTPGQATPSSPVETELLRQPDSKIRRYASDLGVTALKGAIGVPEMAVGVADLVTGGEAGQIAEQLGFRPKEAKDTLDTLYSDEQKAAFKEVADAEGFVPTLGAALSKPSTIVHTALESLPLMGAGALVGRGAMAIAPKLNPIAASAIVGESVVGAGALAEQVRQQDPTGSLTPQQAAIIAATGGITGLIGFGGGKLANKLGIGDPSTMLTTGRLGAVGEEAIQAGANKGIVRKIGEGAVVEGVLQEMPQSFQEQVGQNLALDKPWDEGAAEAAAQGMLAGGLMGGVAGPLGSAAPQPAPVDDTAPATDPLDPAAPGAVPPAATPAGPLAAAAAMVAPREGEAKLFPFSDMAMAQKQADALSQSTGTPHEAGDHPSVPGRFAATPVAIRGSDPLFTAEAERQGLDPATAQLLTQGAQAQALVQAAMAANPDIDPQQWRDPAVRAQLGAAHLKRQVGELESALERTPTPAEAYIAQLVGVPTAAQMLNMPEAERGMPVSSLIPDPAQEDALGVTGMPVGEAVTFLTQQADKALTTLKEQGNANLATDIPSSGSGNRGPAAGAGVGNALGNDAVPAGRAGGTGADAPAMPDVSGNNGNDAGRAGPVAAPRVVVGPSETGFLNVNAQRHRDNADQLGVTSEIERLFGDGLTTNQVVGQMQDKLPSLLPADLPNFVNGVRGTLGIPQPITPEGKGAFDAWRSEYKARQSAPPAPNNAGAAKVTPETIAPQNDVDLAAHESSNSPLNERSTATPGQVDANNYKVGRAEIHGLKVGIENPKGSLRSGYDTDGKPWSTLMTAHYGRFTGTKGADGDAVDTFIGEQPDSPRVFVIDQIDPKTGKFDEHKVILGVNSQQEALDLYNDNYAPGWQGAKAVSETTPDVLKTWLKMGDTTAEFANVAKPTGTTTPADTAAQAKAWHDSPFAPRIQSMLDSLNEAGDTGMAAAIESGVEMEAKQGRLTDEMVAFREGKARVAINTLVNAGKPVEVQPLTFEQLAERNNTVGALPREIGEAALARYNEIAPKLAALGFKDGEVDSRHPKEAQELQRQLKDVMNALHGLAPRRYQSAKEHKNFNPATLERDEDFATNVLGINTRDYPGVSTDSKITLGQGVVPKPGAAAPVAAEPTGTITPAPAARKFAFAGVSHVDAKLPAALVAQVQQALDSRPDSYKVNDNPNDIRISLPNGGQLVVDKDGNARLMGDDQYGWASTMSAASAQRTLKNWLKDMGPAPSTPEPAGASTPDAQAADLKGGEPLTLSQQEMQQRLQNYSKAGKDEQGNQVYRSFNDAGEHEIVVGKDGRIVRDFGVTHVYDLDDKRSVELSYNTLTSEWRATEYGSDNKIVKSVPLSEQDIKRLDRETMLGEKFGAGKVEELMQLAARSPAREWAMRPDARKQPGFNRQQFESDLTRYDHGRVGTSTDPATLPAHKELGKKLADPANYMTPPDQMAGMIAQLDGEIAGLQAKLEKDIADQEAAEKHNGNGWTFVNRIAVARRMLASVTETRDSLAKASSAGAPAADAVPAGQLEIPKPSAQQNKEAARKVLASPYFAVDGLTYQIDEGSETQGGETIWAARAFPEGVTAPAGIFGKSIHSFVEHDGKLWRTDSVGMENVRLEEVTLLDQPLPVDPENPLTGYAKRTPAPAPVAAKAGVNYPNRKLGFQKAASDEDAAYDDKAWANIAAANMQVGDSFKLGKERQTVYSISAKTLKLQGPGGKLRTLNPDGVAWAQFQRDLGGQLTVENLQANNVLKPKRPLIEILKRDPAVHVDDKGSVFLRDGGIIDVDGATAPAQPTPGKTSEYSRKVIAAALEWGFTEETLAVDEHGYAKGVFQNHETALDYDNGKGFNSAKRLAFRVDVAQAPNGEWAQSIHRSTGTEGYGALPNVFGKHYPSRAAALEAGIAEIRKGLGVQYQAELNKAVKALPAAKPEQKPALKQGDIPAELVDFFNKGTSSTKLTPHEEKLARALLAWGYTIKDMPTNMFGRPSDTLRGMDIGLSAGDETRIRLMVTTAQAPNGKWGVGITIRAPQTGSTEGARTLGPQFDTRLAALEYGMAQWRDGALAELKARPRREDDAAYIDKAFAKMEAQLAEMQAKAPKKAAPAAAQAKQPDAPDGGTGQWGSVDAPMKFVSGMTRPGDFKRLFAEDRNVGIQVGELNGPTPAQIGAAMEKSKGWLFVDSGAFPAYQSNKLAFLKALEKGFADWKGEKILSFDQILEKYEALHRAIGEADDSGAASERVFFVMPDVVGRQKDSLELVGEYKSAINGYGDHAILPLQVGELSLTQAYESAMISLLKDPNNDSGPMIGIPSAKEAAPNDQLTALLKKHGDRIPGVHVLGNFADKTLAPRLAAIRAAGYTGNVSADANRLRSLMYGERNRPEAWEALLAETTPDSVKAMLDAKGGKEVSRFAGKFGKGMTQPNAEMAAANRSRKDPDHDYTVEESATLPGKYEVVGREKVAPKGDGFVKLGERADGSEVWANAAGTRQKRKDGKVIGEFVHSGGAFDVGSPSLNARAYMTAAELAAAKPDYIKLQESQGAEAEKDAADTPQALAQIRSQIDAVLDADATLVAAADLDRTHNRFEDFKELYKGKFEQALAGMLDTIGATAYGQISNRIDKLPGYLSQAARKFIETHTVKGGVTPMNRASFVADLAAHGKVQFGEATFELATGAQSSWVVNAAYPGYNSVIGVGAGEAVRSSPPLSRSEAIEQAANAAFDWWTNKRQSDAAFADRRAKLVRAGQREIYGMASSLPDVLAAAKLPLDQFTAKAEAAINGWVASQLAAVGSDADRKLMLQNMVIGGKTTLPKEFFASLQKYATRAARAADLAAARDPVVYKQAVTEAAQQAAVPPQDVPVFMAGWDHSLAGKTKSTLPPGDLYAKGYEAATAWRKTDAGAAWYTGKRGTKLENTGAALRRWFDRASAKVREVSADNLPASYEIIKAQASRAEAFAGVVPEGATPGTQRYVNALRDGLLPFQEWLLSEGPLKNVSGEWISRRAGESTHIAAYLEGRTYTHGTTMKDGKRVSRSDEDATPADRLALLQEAARSYMEVLRQVAGALEGATTVIEAARKFNGLTIANKDLSYYDAARLTATGKVLEDMLRKKQVKRFELDSYLTRSFIATENEPDKAGNRKQALMVPKLDRVVREDGLPDYRKGKNITPKQMKETFGFADIGFGRYVAAKQDQDHLNYAYDAFRDLAAFLGIDPKFIGLGGTLHFSVGALGHGRHAAHFQYAQAHPDGGTVPVINVTNTKGDGTVAHEWLHALDHALNAGYETVTHNNVAVRTWKQDPAVTAVVKFLSKRFDIEELNSRVDPYLLGERPMVRRGRSTPLYDLSTDEGKVANAETAIGWLSDMERLTDYKKQADIMGEDYWGNRKELLARAFEAYVHDNLDGTSNYLVNPEWVAEGVIAAPQYKGAPYPRGEERTMFNEAIGALVKSLRFDAKGVTVDREAFAKAFPDPEAEYKAAKKAMIADLPRRLEQAKLAKRARELAKEQAAAAASEQQAKAAAALAAEKEAERLRLQQEVEKAAEQPQPPTGPLSDDELSSLFDEAVNELTEAAQEQPAEPVPGEAVAKPVSDKWTREDIEYLVRSIDAGTVFLLADSSLGLPTIHDMPSGATRHIGYGTFVTKTALYEAVWSGGGEMQHTPGGKGFTTVQIKDGRGEFLKAINWDEAKTRLQAKLIVKSGPKAAPTLAAEQEKTAAQLAADVAKHGSKALAEGFAALEKIFGFGPGKLQSFPSGFDEEAYRQAKPHFLKMLAEVQAMGQSLKDLFQRLYTHFGAGIKPYAMQFAKDMELNTELSAPASSTARMVEWVRTKLIEGPFTSKQLFEMADDVFGGTQAAGVYSVKDAYDAMEAGVNQYVMGSRITPDGSASDALHKIDKLESIIANLPTQTKRTPEMDEFQQFSTPPQLAFAAAWAANISPGETMLEPSAGVGGLAMYGQLAGARVVVNELSSRRAAVLAEVLPNARLFKENAEQLNNVLPDDIKPTVIVMNPPFSATAGRMQGERKTSTGAQHIEQALKRLQPGGRLVAIVGQGMADDKPTFKEWWKQIKLAYTVRANIGVDGSNYAKYGTTFDNQLLVIDKTGPTTGTVITGKVDTVGQLPALLEGVRNDRQALAGPGASGQPDAAEPGGSTLPGSGTVSDGNRSPEPDALGAGQRDDAAGAGAGPSAPGADGVADQRDDPLDPAGGSGLPGQPGVAAGGKRTGGGTGGRGGRGGNGGGRGTGAAGTPVQRTGGDGAVKNGLSVEATETAPSTEAMTDAIFENYQPQRLSIPGAKAHPGKLVQSAAMSAVQPPKPTYTPHLPKNVITGGLLSLAQLEAVVYAGQAHEQMLPGGKERRGFFIGDGTGVGKGREIAGIILDNFRQGRKKAVWMSAKQGLVRDAKRDFAGISGDEGLIHAHNKTKSDGVIAAKDGILFTTYDTLAAGQKAANDTSKGSKAARTRMDQIVEWLGADFDGVIAFDEAHNMGNVMPKKGKRGSTKPAAKALAGVKLQERLPNARIVYVSATGATEVSNLAYASRLGLWGEGSAFAKASDFVGAIEGGGVAAMELVSRDMKAAGSYLARSLSFDGVTYERLDHDLTPLQTDIYNELAKAWQLVLQNVNAALETTNQAKDSGAKSAALSKFWGGHQRFFNHIITAMQMPSIIDRAQQDLAAGRAVVMQLVNTNEAEQSRQVAKIAADDDATFEDLDFTPRESLLGYIRTGFPVAQYEEYTDENGDKHVRPVVDAAGKPVVNREMVEKRDALVKTLESIRVPDNPIDMILNAFGSANVAEITGRSKRFVQERNARGEFKVVEQKRPASAVVADADAFMGDKKRVLVFSDAGGTGYSFQSDLGAKNQRRRVHYLVQPGWRANNAVQGFGRTHRSNEANQPHYVLPTTNLKAQKRFISSIARRLDQLGALTKGQRETGGQGMFSAADNLESEYAADALHNLFLDMYRGASPLSFRDTTEAMGLTGLIDDRTGALNMSKLPQIPQFLNRLLSLTTDMQDTVFDEFFKGLVEIIERAKARGDFDAGMETLRADKVVKLRDEVVYTDKRTDATTRYIELELTHPTDFNSFETALANAATYGDRFLGFFRNERTGRVFAQVQTGTSTLDNGQLVTRGARVMTTGSVRYTDDVDTVTSGAKGHIKIKKKVEGMVYQRPASGPLVEEYESERASTPGTMKVRDDQLAALFLQGGLEAARASIEEGRGSHRTPRGTDAALRLAERMAGHLVPKTVDIEVNAHTKLTEAQARAAWAEEHAATPPTYTSRTHLLSGILLPIWDRLQGSPRVVRTQTEDGERLLGRVVSARDLEKTLKNLGVGSNLSAIPMSKIIERIMGGERALLANGWTLQKARVANENRIEVSGADLGYSRTARDLLVSQGAFIERINWNERVFVPTGDKGEETLTRILANKPLVDMLGKDDEEAALSRANASGAGLPKADVQSMADAVRAGWANAPAVTVVQRVSELPFKASADARGAYYQGRVWLVGENLNSEAEVQFVMGHEALGHRGLAAIMEPRQLETELNRLRMINPALAKAAREQVSKYGYDLVTATEEALADMAGAGVTIKGWQKFVHAVQQVLRALGLDHVANWIERHTQAETMSLLRRAREAIEGKRRPRNFDAAAAARFSDGASTNWYSTLSRQLAKTVTKSASPTHWGNTIMGSGFAQQGVKQDEIEWSGVLDWLLVQAEAGVTKVSKEQLLDYLAQNGVRVEEVMKGHDDVNTEDDKAEFIDGYVADRRREYQRGVDAAIRERLKDALGGFYTRESATQPGRFEVLWKDDPKVLEVHDDEDAAIDAMDVRNGKELDALEQVMRGEVREFAEDTSIREAEREYASENRVPDDTKYRNYTLDGGQRYRELLLMLPNANGVTMFGDIVFNNEDSVDDFLTDVDAAGLGNLDYGTVENHEGDRRMVEFKDLTQADYGTFQRLAAENGGRISAQQFAGQHAYRSGHWDEQNVLAHIRFNERTDADGARVLFVEELQSDWAAAARKRGFTATDAERMAASERARQLLAEQQRHHPGSSGWNALTDLIAEQGRIMSNSADTVPRAPFMRTTDAWVSLAVKRVISYAAQQGYDKVAFINGQQSADRYSLSKQVGQIELRNADGKGDVGILRAYDMNGQIAIEDTIVRNIQELAGLIGEAPAQKLVEAVPFGKGPVMYREIGPVEGMKVGGEGMVAFYDKVVPNIVNDVLKKLGGGRTEEVDVVLDAPYDPKPGHTNYVDEDGRLQVVWHGEGPGHGKNRYYNRKGWMTQTGFAISDGLRQKAAEGLPLFSRSAMKDNDANVRRGTEAMNQALLNKTTVHRAMFRTGLGWVDFEWGDSKKGIAHIIAQRMAKDGMSEAQALRFLTNNVVAAIANGSVERTELRGTSLNMRLVNGEDVAVLVQNPGSNGWVLTAFEKWPSGGQGGGFDPVPPTHAVSTVTRHGMGADGNAIIGQTENPPLFSRSAAAISRQAGSAIKQVTVTDVKNKLVDYRGIGLQALGRRQIMDLYGDLFPQGTKDNLLEAYNKLAMQMDADKNEAGAEADTITTEWAKLADERELAELMHDATRLQIDPSKPFVLGDIKRDYTDLSARYKALSPAARKIFHDASRAYTKHYDAVRAAVHERIVRAMPGHPNQAAMLTKMDAEFFGKIKGIYFPLARFGDYMVQVKWSGANPPPGAQPAREAVHFAETMAEAEALRTELLKQYPASKGYLVNKVTRRAEYNAGRDSVGRGFLQELFNMFKNTGMDPSLQDAINQLYLTSLPDLSWAKHGIHRKGTPGFSQDARRAFANHMFHGARYLAKLNYADQMSQSLDDMQHYSDAHAQDAGYDQVKAQQVIDEMLKRHDIYMNPKTNPLSTALTSFGFVFYLGLSPASAAVNLSQTALVAYPILGGRYGFAKAGAALLEASKVALQGHNDLGKVLAGDELAAYQGWVKSGVIDVSMAHDLAGVAQGEDHKMFGQMRKVMKVASYMFHHAERFNRGATALAAYRLARGSGMDHDAAYDAAVKDTYAGHFDYAAGNRPRLMQGDVARVVLLFKQYAQNMVYTFGRNAALTFKGDKQALKTLSGLLVSHALAAGVLGLPVVGTLLAVASALGSSDDEPWDAEIALRNMLAETFGNKAGEVLAHGLSRLTPWDLSARVGLNQLLLPDFQEGLEGGRMAESVITRLLGPIAGVGVNLAKGANSIAEGHVQRGLEQMLPVALRGPLKAIRYEQEGVRDITGVELLPDTTMSENLGQALGFSPGRAREAQEGKSAIYQTDRALQSRRQQLMTEYAEKLMNQEDPSATLGEIRSFNQLHPNRMIAPLHLQQSVRARLQRKAQAQQGVFLPARRSDARAAGQFASELPE